MAGWLTKDIEDLEDLVSEFCGHGCAMFDFYGSFRELKDFERMRKQENIGKRDFKQIEKVHKKKTRERGVTMDAIIKLFTETGFVMHVVLLTAVIILLHVLLKED